MKYFVLSILVFMSCICFGQGTVGPIAHWDMNNSPNDVTGNGHDGHMNFLTPDTGIDGVYGHAYYFNGVNSSITTAPSAAYNLSNYSICATIKAEGFYTGTCQANMIFLKGKTGGSVASYALEFKDKPTTGYDCYTYDTTKETFWSWTSNLSASGPGISAYYYDPPINENQWYKVVATFNDTAYRIYVDGVLKVTANILSPGTPMGTELDSASIGYDIYEESIGYPYPFKGAIDDVILFGRVLSDTEIAHYGDTCGTITSIPLSVVGTDGGSAHFDITTNITGAIYQWQVNDGTGFVNLTNTSPYSGVNTSSLIITGATLPLDGNNYRCMVTNIWGCADTSSSALMTTGIQDVAVANIVSIYPNPSSDIFTISLSGSSCHGSYQIYDQLGKLISNGSISTPKTNIDLSAFTSGIYYIKVLSAYGTECQKLMKR